MATQHINASTTSTASPILTVKGGVRQYVPVTIYNGHSASIFIGDSSIATSGATIGRTIPATSSQTFYCNSGDVIYAISAASSAAGAIVITYSA